MDESPEAQHLPSFLRGRTLRGHERPLPHYAFRMVRATVRQWDEGLGWGVLDSPETPEGCWTHFSAIKTPFVGRQGTTEVFEYKTVEPGEVVDLEWEKADQDGFQYRAVTVQRD